MLSIWIWTWQLKYNTTSLVHWYIWIQTTSGRDPMENPLHSRKTDSHHVDAHCYISNAVTKILHKTGWSFSCVSMRTDCFSQCLKIQTAGLQQNFYCVYADKLHMWSRANTIPQKLICTWIEWLTIADMMSLMCCSCLLGLCVCFI